MQKILLYTYCILLLLVVLSCTEEAYSVENINNEEFQINLEKVKDYSSTQGMAINDNYFFVLASGGSCRIYDLDNDSSKTRCSFRLKNRNHCNCANFGLQKVEGATFPLLYISNGTANVTTENYCWVESITQLSDSVFRSDLAQVLILDKDRFENAGYVKPVACPQWLIDNERCQLWTFSLTTRSSVTAMGNNFENSKVVATCFPIPSLEEGDTVTLSEKDVIKQVTFDADAYILQGGCIKDGIIFMAYGYGGNGNLTPTKLRAYNTDTGKIDMKLNLQDVITKEPEDIAIYNEKIYLNCHSYIYSINTQDAFHASELQQQGKDIKFKIINE